MLKRAIALSLALIIGIGTMIPLATEFAEAGPKKTKRYKKKDRKYKKYSKAWWRQYRAKQKRKRALLAKKRKLRLRQLRLARARKARKSETAAKPFVKTKPVSSSTSSLLPSGQSAPSGWKASTTSAGELQFRIDSPNGHEVGSASISVVGPSMGATVTSGKNLALGGVPTTSLRREVINRMIAENGWVVNDYQKNVGGRAVYVVVAQSPGSKGSVNARMFYFTEADGRIYSVATNAPVDSAERLAEESEKVITSLSVRPRPVQQASTKE